MRSLVKSAALTLLIFIMPVVGHAQDAREPQTFVPTNATVKPSGTWSIGARAGNFVFIGGMRGVDPANGKLISGDEARIYQMFENMLSAAALAGATKRDAVRLTIFVTDVAKFRPLINAVQKRIWGNGPYPPRTVLGVSSLDQGDIAEIDGTFYAPKDR